MNEDIEYNPIDALALGEIALRQPDAPFVYSTRKKDEDMADTNTRAVVAMMTDLPRVLRSDMTRLTELIAKYRGFGTLLREAERTEAADEVEDIQVGLITARESIEHVVHALSSSAGGPMGPNIQEAEVTTVGGKMGVPRSLTTILVEAGFVSKLDVAKKGIEGEHVHVDGKIVADADAKLEPGEYVIKCGEVTQSIRVT